MFAVVGLRIAILAAAVAFTSGFCQDPHSQNHVCDDVRRRRRKGYPLSSTPFRGRSSLLSIATQRRPITTTSTTLKASSVNSGKDKDGKTLYDILGASRDASTAELRRRYLMLAKMKHPDAINAAGASEDHSGSDRAGTNQQQQDDMVDFTQIAAAWSVLSNEKERRKYDRTLQRQELANNFESFLDAGLRNAIPFVQKTANTAVSVATTSSKAINNVSQRMSREMDRRELENKIKRLEQQYVMKLITQFYHCSMSGSFQISRFYVFFYDLSTFLSLGSTL